MPPISRRAFVATSGSCAAHLALAAAVSPRLVRELWAARPRGPVVATAPFARLERVGHDIWALVSTPLGGDNANSLVLDVEYRGRRILLTGDLESPGLDDLLAESPRHCDVILTPHHGSARSNPPGFAAWSTPELAIVSGSFNDRRPEVERAYLASGARLLNTADSGAIRVTIDAAGWHAATWKTP
ncbi:MAG: ComEC/Rec2 family competence protein [Gemmatimonadaceae bacterium]